MGKPSPHVASVAFALALIPSLGGAATGGDADVAALRAELAALKSDYAERVASLEARLEQLEIGAAAVPAEPAAPPPAPASTASAFNPAISVILAGNYANLSEDPATYQIAGFIPSGGESGPGERGFNLGESELTFAANVDPYFSASLTAAVSAENEIGVEEAFVRTSALPGGVTIKGGRYFSGIGYLNELHAHAWDFIDQPLAYQAFFGGQLAQEGVQVKWLAPTDLFLELGAEAGNGGEFPGTRRNRNGLDGLALFAHAGGDLGDTASWRAGASFLEHEAEGREYQDLDSAGLEVTNAFTGTSRTWVADATFKWRPAGTPPGRILKLQAEYLQRTENGTLAFDIDGLAASDSYRSDLSAWYVQGVYQFRPRWRMGLRYDDLDSGNTRIGLVQSGDLPATDFPLLQAASPSRLSLMLDWNPSEFSRLRAQYAWDDARNAERDQQLFIQYVFSIGAHGAHKF